MYAHCHKSSDLRGLVGWIANKVPTCIKEYISQNCQRVVAPPPPEQVERARRVFDLLFDLGGSHHVLHGVRGTTHSKLLADVEAILRMDAGSILERGGPFVH